MNAANSQDYTANSASADAENPGNTISWPDGGVVTQRTANPLAVTENRDSSHDSPSVRLTEIQGVSSHTANSGFVYFVCTKQHVKIGFATDVKRRIAELQIACPDELTWLADIPGTKQDERAYHQRFAQHSVRGEWFIRHPDIMGEIRRLIQERRKPFLDAYRAREAR